MRIATALLAVATIAISLWMLTVFPGSADLPNGFWTPIVAFELARTEADLLFLSGTSAQGLRDAMDAGQYIDFAYAFAYGGLLAAVFFALRPAKIAWAGVLCGLLAIPADNYENAILLEITAALSAGESAAELLPALVFVTWSKWLLLGTAMAILAVLMWKRNVVVAGLAAVAAVLVVAAFISQSAVVAEVMLMALVVAFLAIAIRAFARLLPRWA